MKLDKYFVVYKDGKRITLSQAKALEDDWSHLYIGMGKRDLDNPYFCIEMLSYLSETNQIESYIYKGPELKPYPSEKGVVY